VKLKIAGIKREEIYSPNHINNDSLIFLKTIQELMNFDIEVKIYEETEIYCSKVDEEVIFTMARGNRVLDDLIKLESEGKKIINSPKGSLNCYRVNLVPIMKDAGVPFPNSRVVPTNSDENYRVTDVGIRKIWIKRGDVHAIHREDVSLVYGDEELNFTLKEYARRGIKKAVLQEHIYGDVIKFYSVGGTDFFRWYYVNGNNNYRFDINLFKDLAERSAEALGLQIYGGDAIVSENGDITIIDVNDWPSFAPFRTEASKYIAERIYSASMNYIETIN
jgi:hypothetical protein